MMNTTAFKRNLNKGQSVPEGKVAKTIEEQTAKIPSDTFLWAALGTIGVSMTLQLFGKKEISNFVGQWAPTLLILGLYNKMVKITGPENETGDQSYFGV
jgi:hypothetical protein